MVFDRKARVALLAAAVSTLLAGCPGGSDTWTPESNIKPAFVGTITKTIYDGASDDLLTAGLGKTGLAGAAPVVANPIAPTAAELRKLAIFNNYRAILDISANGGYGSLYGPNIDVNGNPTLGEGKVAGTEYLAYADDGTGKLNVTMIVQIPASFSPAAACIVTATSSGSRGVYGAIGSAGEWGLKRGCVVAYTDKGTGTGFHDLATDTVNLQNGVRSGAAAAGKDSNFTATLTAAELASFNAATPNRVAVKHAHSQRNPEKDWGLATLNAIRFAFYVLNEERGLRNSDGTAKPTFKPDNTLVIASSVSNGAGAAIAAAEQDTEGLIDGVAVAEPTLELVPPAGLTVRQGNTVKAVARPLYDYYTLGNLYMPCASQSARAANSYGIAAVLPVPAFANNRCAALKAKGLLTKASTQEQADESLDILLAAGYEVESIPLFASHYIAALRRSFPRSRWRTGGSASPTTSAASRSPPPMPPGSRLASQRIRLRRHSARVPVSRRPAGSRSSTTTASAARSTRSSPCRPPPACRTTTSTPRSATATCGREPMRTPSACRPASARRCGRATCAASR